MFGLEDELSYKNDILEQEVERAHKVLDKTQVCHRNCGDGRHTLEHRIQELIKFYEEMLVTVIRTKKAKETSQGESNANA